MSSVSFKKKKEGFEKKLKELIKKPDQHFLSKLYVTEIKKIRVEKSLLECKKHLRGYKEQIRGYTEIVQQILPHLDFAWREALRLNVIRGPSLRRG
jgi:hypothetical protein